MNPTANVQGAPAPGRRGRRRAVVLLVVLVVVAALSLAAYQYSDLMLTEYHSADTTVRTTQARAFAESGVQYVAALLSNPDNLTTVLQGNPYDNPAAFQNVLIQPSDAPRFQGRFSAVAPPYATTGAAGTSTFYYGVVDESSRINISALVKLDPTGKTAEAVLMALPNMTQNYADALIDWVDANDNPLTAGAESSTYSALTPAYQAKDGPMDTVEEMLLVSGMPPQIVYGNDLNRNGMLDAGEDDGTGASNPGLAGYLTVYTREFNVDSQGNPRVFVNGNSLQNIYNKLSPLVGQELATFIILYRQYGGTSPTTSGGAGQGGGGNQGGGGQNKSGGGSGQGGGSGGLAVSTTNGQVTGASSSPGSGQQGGGSKSGGTVAVMVQAVPTKTGSLSGVQLDFSKQGSNQIASLYDLIGASVTVPPKAGAAGPGAPPPAATKYQSPLTQASLSSLLPTLLDEATTKQGQVLPGRVNVNTASPAVLTAIFSAVPSITADKVQAVLGAQPPPADMASADPIFQSPAWLLVQGGLTPGQMKQLEPYITTRTQVYRAQVLGYFDEGTTFARVEAVIDTNGGRPRVLLQRDISELGKAFDLSQGQ
jgi:hypothetical protein